MPGLVDKAADKLLDLGPQLDVLLPELGLRPGQPLQLVRQLERCQDGVAGAR
jgi:hypothetical protein